ncbi:hypothetical protein CEXT_335551 [Caerostris extrusa]|uniref:Uncharacterized protein n=1 Tax=Caerostris extrusa TaxID=172846 RepID=A0AAV4UUG0_CAEEX|nr:hypothetical protein CEXT_335551 [Caerostris extrusa]
MHRQQRNLCRWDENKSAAERDIAIRSVISLPRKQKWGETKEKKCKPTSFLPVTKRKGRIRMESERKGKIHLLRERIPGKSEKILISFFTLQFPQRNTSIQHTSHRMTPSLSPLRKKKEKWRNRIRR